MENNIQLIILKNYALLKLSNEDGSSAELRLTKSQLKYIEKTIENEKRFESLKDLYRSETAQQSINAGLEVSKLLGY